MNIVSVTFLNCFIFEVFQLAIKALGKYIYKEKKKKKKLNGKRKEIGNPDLGLL